jgi:hypothetical protein
MSELSSARKMSTNGGKELMGYYNLKKKNKLVDINDIIKSLKLYFKMNLRIMRNELQNRTQMLLHCLLYKYELNRLMLSIISRIGVTSVFVSSLYFI